MPLPAIEPLSKALNPPQQLAPRAPSVGPPHTFPKPVYVSFGGFGLKEEVKYLNLIGQKTGYVSQRIASTFPELQLHSCAQYS